MYLEAGTCSANTGPNEIKITIILKSVLTFSTSSVENGPPYLSFAKSILDGR